MKIEILKIKNFNCLKYVISARLCCPLLCYTFYFFVVVVIPHFSPYIPVFHYIDSFLYILLCCHGTHFTYTYTTVDVRISVRTSIQNYNLPISSCIRLIC
jgi:hypothetical protein